MIDTKIEWADHTVNFWWGCSKISPACQHCYAETMAARWRADSVTWGTLGKRWIRDKAEAEARKIDALSLASGGLHRAFVNSMSDSFEAHPALVAPRRDMLDLLASLTGTRWLLLTKRPQQVLTMIPPHWRDEWPAHIWIGTTVEDQQRAEERLPALLEIPAPGRFLSCEPLLGPVDLWPWLGDHEDRPTTWGTISWVIAGGESGPHARPMHPDWPRALRDQCSATATHFFFKQWGEWDQAKPIPTESFHQGKPRDGHVFVQEDGEIVVSERVGKKRAGRLLDGIEWSETPSR